ncbi:SDR family NAD(P)-dependent oxidoreductase [Microvirga sp. 2MCAF35]|uniref:SDR family NAD(P)-dependent oxidoreductase n=1 Tax=Microvirga sp. 2MCAF35 TaxID=3232987 RepID=UPI003F98FEB7
MRDFQEKTIIITGGGGGIGSAMARHIASRGGLVAVFDRDPNAAEKTVSAIKAEGGTAQAFACDITVRDQVEQAVANTEKAFGSIVASPREVVRG